nr:acylphosphatase [Caldisphaeraceae archaeon]
MTNESLKAYSIKIVGIVQGVGFRPFIYRLAIKYGLKGYVVNLGGSEVEIHVEGPEKYLRIFLSKINEEKPPPAYIEKLSVNEIKPLGFSNFTIKKSEKRFSNISIIPPDIGICNDCLREIHDKNTRFYRYYWNSCAWCGPRFSMIYDLPYDRENTSMRKYPLCSACNKDYGDPKNIRRFHAQGISCPLCGPRTYVY